MIQDSRLFEDVPADRVPPPTTKVFPFVCGNNGAFKASNAVASC
jgi:hypothetical protein